MSPEAVTARLKTMNELWILSVKLMNNKKVEPDLKVSKKAIIEVDEPNNKSKNKDN